MQTQEKFDLSTRLTRFSADIIRLTGEFPGGRAYSHIAGQLIRSGTAPMANHGEAQCAESRRDFVHKLRICGKEIRETSRWLRLLEELDFECEGKLASLNQEANELERIFFASIRTAAKGLDGSAR
jgi:four helix bundle protein